MVYIKTKITALNKSKPRYTTYYARIPKIFFPDVKDRVPIYDSENKVILFVDEETANKLLREGYRVKVELLPPLPVTIEIGRRRQKAEKAEQATEQASEQVQQAQPVQATVQGQQQGTAAAGQGQQTQQGTGQEHAIQQQADQSVQG